MTLSELEKISEKVLSGSINFVTAENAAHTDLIGMKFYEQPLFGIADANDPMFEALRRDVIKNDGYLLPGDIVPGARSVISWFLPFSEDVRRDNSRSLTEFSDAWRQARVEGQETVFALGSAIVDALAAEGYSAVQPSQSAFFKMLAPFCSNWSERHTAYIAGLGTFGLSKGLITKLGMAGRIGSVVTDAPMNKTCRGYTSPFEWCSMCGACAKRCPALAIDPSRGVANGKDHTVCQPYLGTSGVLQPCGKGEKQRYGCGKCQTGVPCEHMIPEKLL